ncbi:hypothetical protein V6N13_126818 [Hibiscus sabdariffa]
MAMAKQPDKHLTKEQHQTLFEAMLKQSIDGKLKKGSEPARRNSKNRQVGTLETKPILSVTKDVTRSCLIDKVLPAIRAKWPSYSDKTIFIQQDNAKPHIGVDGEEFLQPHQESPTTIDELVNALEKSFDELAPESLNNVFLSFQSCMIEIMKIKGGNNYRLPHMSKQRLERNGELPIQLHCDQDIVQEALMYIQLQH